MTVVCFLLSLLNEATDEVEPDLGLAISTSLGDFLIVAVIKGETGLVTA